MRRASHHVAVWETNFTPVYLGLDISMAHPLIRAGHWEQVWAREADGQRLEISSEKPLSGPFASDRQNLIRDLNTLYRTNNDWFLHTILSVPSLLSF